MADTIANYTGNGTQTDFVVPFDYLKKSFVRVYLDSTTLLTGGDYGDTGADYYFLDDTTIRLKNAPAQDVLVTIRRYTSATERIVSFEDASILKATDLDTSQLQSFHIAEEARDNVNDALLKNDEGAWDAQDARISNVADPIDDQDAMTLGYYKKDKESVIEMRDEVEGYRDETLGFRNETEGFRDTTEGYKDEAEVSKNLAKDWAVKMDGKVVEEGEEVDYSAKYWAQSVAEMGEAALVVADNIEDVNTTADNITHINIVGGDLEGTIKIPSIVDMGRVGTGNNTPEVEITGGNIKVVADNITAVDIVAGYAADGSLAIAINSVQITNENVRLAQEAQRNTENARDTTYTYANNASTSATLASESAVKAKEWAIKTDGLVDDLDYSAKYYAQQAKESEGNTAGTLEAINTAVSQGLSSISSAGDAEVADITSAGTTQVGLVNTAGQTQVNAVNTAGQTQVGLVEDEGETQVQLVQTEGSTQKGLITTEGTTQVSKVTSSGSTAVSTIQTTKDNAVTAITEAQATAETSIEETGTAQKNAVTTEGTTQVGLVNTAGTTQVEKVNTAGTNAVASVNSTRDSLIADLQEEAETQSGIVEAEGTEQVGLVQTAGTTQVSSVNNAGSTQITAIGNATNEAIADITPYVQKAHDWAEKTDGEVETGAYSAKYWAQQATSGQLNADWNETDPSNKGYIRNKPDLSIYALKTDISTVYKYKGSVDTYDQLPVASQAVGDVYNIATDDASHGIKAGDNVVWNGTYWDNLSGYVDLSPYLTIENASNIYLRKDTASTTYATKSEVTSGLSGKLDSATYTLDKNTFATKTELSSYATKTELGTKLDTSTYTTDKDTFALKTELNSYATKAELSSYATKSEIPDVSGFQTKTQHDADIQKLETEVATKANSADVYKKTEVYTKTDVYTKTEVYNKTEVDNKITSSRITDYGRVGT